MLIIGLTGGIATGKSTVSRILSSPPYNLPIIDADVLARQVVEPGTPGYRAIVSYFGPTTPDLLVPADPTPITNDNDNTKQPGVAMPEDGPDGRGRPLNRPALGRRVFGDDPARRRDRARLNAIVHPAVRRAAYGRLLALHAAGWWAVVWDVPLLFEVGTDLLCGAVVVVAVADPSVQLARLRARDRHLSQEEAEARVGSQMGVDVKVARCRARGEGRGVVVWNDGGLEELRGEVGRAVEGLRRGSPAWWGRLLWVCPVLAVGVGVWNVALNWWSVRRWEREERAARARL